MNEHIEKNIKTDEYQDFMFGEFKDRHTIEAQKKYGVWRWAGMQQYGYSLFSLFKQNNFNNLKVIDFGGALAPLGFESIIVDTKNKDINDNDVLFNSLSQIEDNSVDILFASHVLEHVLDFKQILFQIKDKLKKDAYFVIHSPSIFGKEYWSPEKKKEHYRIFSLKESGIPDELNTLIIDFALEQFNFNIVFADYCEDDCLFVIARKRG